MVRKRIFMRVLAILAAAVIVVVLFLCYRSFFIREHIERVAKTVELEDDGGKTATCDAEEFIETLNMDAWSRKGTSYDLASTFYALINDKYLMKFFDNGDEEMSYCSICDYRTNYKYQVFWIDPDTFSSIRQKVFETCG